MIATDPLSLVFIFCFVLGFGFFLVAGLMGGHAHGGHGAHIHIHMPVVHHAPGVHGAGHAVHAPGGTHAQTGQGTGNNTSNQQENASAPFSLAGIFNPTSIALFLLGFGVVGYILHNLTPAGLVLSLIFSILGSVLLTAGLLTLLGRLMVGVESSTEQDVVDRTGMLGRVSITIPEKGLGEVLYTSPGGMRKSIPARGLNGQRLERDLEVVVVNYQNGVAEVDTWEHFMHGEIASAPAPSASSGNSEGSFLHLPEIEMLMQQQQHRRE